MLLKENQSEIEKLLKQEENTKDEMETAKLAVKHVQGKILQARDEGKDEKAIKLQSDLDAAKNKVEILELAIKKGEVDTRKFIEKKIDAEVKIFVQRQAEYKNGARKLMAQIGTNLKNAREIAKVLPGEIRSSLSHIELCLKYVDQAVLRGCADVDISAIKEFIDSGVELTLFRSLVKNITDKQYVINKMYFKARRGDYE